jgi:uncharacterized protein (DUF433 family)
LADITEMKKAPKDKGAGRGHGKSSAAKSAEISRSHSGAQRVVLGKYIVADDRICHGKPTYKGTRIMVWQILQAMARGESIDELVQAWGGRVSRAAILETIRLAGGALLDSHGRLNPTVDGQLAA